MLWRKNRERKREPLSIFLLLLLFGCLSLSFFSFTRLQMIDWSLLLFSLLFAFFFLIRASSSVTATVCMYRIEWKRMRAMYRSGRLITLPLLLLLLLLLLSVVCLLVYSILFATFVCYSCLLQLLLLLLLLAEMLLYVLSFTHSLNLSILFQET